MFKTKFKTTFEMEENLFLKLMMTINRKRKYIEGTNQLFSLMIVIGLSEIKAGYNGFLNRVYYFKMYNF